MPGLLLLSSGNFGTGQLAFLQKLFWPLPLPSRHTGRAVLGVPAGSITSNRYAPHSQGKFHFVMPPAFSRLICPENFVKHVDRYTVSCYGIPTNKTWHFERKASGYG